MPLVPESRRSRQDVKASIGSQFWEQPVHSTKSVDGQLWSLPCEPPALNLTGSSGLSRTQQLLAAQAVRIPLIPSFDGSSDGLVLDRVLAKAGGRRWWTALSGRVKAQRAYRLATAGQDVSKAAIDAARDLSNYALCARARCQLGRRLSFNGVAEAPDVRALRTHLAQRRSRSHTISPTVSVTSDGPVSHAPYESATSLAALEGSAGLADGGPQLEPVRAHATLRCALPGHDLSATAGYNLPYVDSSGDAAHVPLAVSLDLGSHDRQDGLQYRVGLHQVTAPFTEALPKPGIPQRWRTSLHAQGALAVEGEAYIWRGALPAGAGNGSSAGGGNGSPAGGPASGSTGAQASPEHARSPGSKPPSKSGASRSGADEAGGQEPRRTNLAAALASAAAAEAEDVSEDQQQSQASPGQGKALRINQLQAGRGRDGRSVGTIETAPVNSDTQPPQPDSGLAAARAAPPAVGQAAPSQVQQSASLHDFVRPLEQLGGQVSDMLHHVTHPTEPHPTDGSKDQHTLQQAQQHHQQQPQRSQPNAASDAVGGAPAPPPSLLGMSSESITATIQESVALLQQLRESVERLTGNVQDGSLQRLSQQLADSRGAPQRRRPYSMLLAQPHLKLNAALGCLARMPLPAVRALSLPHASLEPLDAGSGGASLPARQASTSSLASRASASSQLAEAWQPYFKGTALRVFASAALSGQLGRFTRPWLDYTAASARVDVGLTSAHVVGVVPDPATLAPDSSHRPDKHRAFALEGRGAWHALSLSLAQQVYGPVRARVDARCALDPTSVPASEGERSTLKGVLQTVLSVRPSLLETVYGFDCVLPGTEGAARLAVWFSPKRRECMAELRLF